MKEVITNNLQLFLEEKSLDMKDLESYLTKVYGLKHNDIIYYHGSTLTIEKRNMGNYEWFPFEVVKKRKK